MRSNKIAYLKREIIKAATTASQDAATKDYRKVINTLMDQITILERETVTTASSFSEILSERIDKLEEIQTTEKYAGIKTRFTKLDLHTGGFQPSDLIVLAARPAMGKTSLALNIAYNAVASNTPVGFFSLEMSKSQLIDRMIVRDTKIPSQKLRTGRISPGEWEKIHGFGDKYSDLPLHINDTGSMHYSEIREKAYGMYEQGVRMIFIDHLHLCRGDSRVTRDREVGSITGALKALAKELDIPVVLLSQLNRGLEQRPFANNGRIPRLSDLRDSGNIEQDADIVMFLYRPSVYDSSEQYDKQALLRIAKHRNGPCFDYDLLFDDVRTLFYEKTEERYYGQ